MRSAFRSTPNLSRTPFSAEELKGVRDRLGVDRNALLIGSFGSVGPHGDIRVAMAAVEKLKRERPLSLVWLGKSGLHPERGAGWQQGNQSPGEGSRDIIWTGPLPHPDVSRLMAACDLFVLPYIDGISSKRT